MNKKQIIVAVILVVIIGGIGALIYFMTPKTQLHLAIAPSVVNLKIDDGNFQRVKNGQNIPVSSGDHTITISEDEFTGYSTKISIKNNETQELLVALTPNTDAARARISDLTSQDIVQRFHGKTFSSDTDQLNKDYPILKVLPITARFYRIYPCPSQKYPGDTTKIAVCVETNQDGIEPYVEKDLASRGYNTADYEMIYVAPEGE